MTSLEELMDRTENRQKLIVALNGIELYPSIVRKCGYRRIGIQVLDNGEGVFAYTSFNDASGKIVDVKKGLHQPQVTGYVKERVLLEILEKAEEVQQHPLKAALQYAPAFALRPRSAYWRIMKALV
ncbi:hypothetical protein J4210_06445 [Candidatus Woesearchaeota archaeon]|nr:hypothetical protein [Candidatus Woesearchaeota archaeon]